MYMKLLHKFRSILFKQVISLTLLLLDIWLWHREWIMGKGSLALSIDQTDECIWFGGRAKST